MSAGGFSTQWHMVMIVLFAINFSYNKLTETI